jgi:hypothetical protein
MGAGGMGDMGGALPPAGGDVGAPPDFGPAADVPATEPAVEPPPPPE